MSRAKLMVLVLLLPLGLAACGSEEGPDRPNVILLVMDTVRADRCSVNGYERPTTPALEALAREGINFRNTWSPAGWAGPAHASMFSGLLPERHGYRRRNREYLDRRTDTLAERLQREGYRTACLTNNPTIGPEFGLDQGFENYYPLYLDENVGYPSAPATHQKAFDWAKRVHDRQESFFLFINDMEAHFPYTPPETFREKFRDRSIPPEATAGVERLAPRALKDHLFGKSDLTADELRLMSDLYDAEIACLDQAIGHFVELLRSSGMLENTLLIITSDHGENLGEHGLVDHMFSLNRTIRHVPLVLKLPGSERAGEVTDEVARLEDIFPTILEVCGLPIPGNLDGESLHGDLTDRRARATLDAPVRLVRKFQGEIIGVFDPTPFLVNYRAVFDGRLHWIHGSDGSLQVFDVIMDPAEAEPLRGVSSGSPRSGPLRRKTPETGLLHR